MSNCILAYPDKALTASLLGGGSWQLPLAHLQEDVLNTKARSADCQITSTYWYIDLGSLTDVRVIALLNHNASPTATISIRMATDVNFNNIVYTSSVLPFYGVKYPQGGLPWGHPDLWSGGIVSATDLTKLAKQFYLVVTEEYSLQARYVDFQVTDTTNPDGYFELSRCFIAPGWQPGVNMGYGASFGRETATESETISGGATYFNIKKSKRTAEFILELPVAQAVSFASWMQIELDIHGELFFVFDPEDTSVLEQQRSFLATMRELTPLEYPYYNTNTVGYKLVEKQ